MSNIYCFLIRSENIYHSVDKQEVLVKYVLKNRNNWCECYHLRSHNTPRANLDTPPRYVKIVCTFCFASMKYHK